MGWRKRVTKAECQGAGANGMDGGHRRHRPTGSTASAAAAGGVGTSKQPRALCLSGCEQKRGAVSPGRGVGGGGTHSTAVSRKRVSQRVRDREGARQAQGGQRQADWAGMCWAGGGENE